jgi:hypothetical protein
MTVIILLFILLLAIAVAAPTLRLAASMRSPASLAYIAYMDNIASFFLNNSAYPTIRISGCNQPHRPITTDDAYNNLNQLASHSVRAVQSQPLLGERITLC